MSRLTRPIAAGYWFGLLVWAAPVLVISIWVAYHPYERTVTPIYHAASNNWMLLRDIYHGPDEFNYLPQFAILFLPFSMLPVPMGDVAWRLLVSALLITGLFRLTGLEQGEKVDRMFLAASILSIFSCDGAIRNGQGSALFAALLLHGVASLPREQWWRASAFLIISLAVRPIALVPLLLAPAFYAGLRWRMTLFFLLCAVIPFFCAPYDYVIAQYYKFAINIGSCTAHCRREFADWTGILRAFNIDLACRAKTIASMISGLVALIIWKTSASRIAEPFRAFWLLALSASYLMLFNPMNEVNTYVIFAPVLSIWAVFCIRRTETRRFGYFTAAAALSIGILPELLRPLFQNTFAPFYLPLVTILFAGYLSIRVYKPWSVIRSIPSTNPPS